MRAWLPAFAGCLLHFLPASAGPVINEILFRPGIAYPENTALEFVEIHNPAAEPEDLSGWRIAGGIGFEFPAGTQIAAGGYLVVAADPAALVAATGLAGILGPWDPGKRLSNSGERVVLEKPDGDKMEPVDTVTYSDEGDWAFRAWDAIGGWKWITQTNGGGTSLERRNPLLAVDNGQNWGDSGKVGGTPGAPNVLLTDDIAPIIARVVHSPAVPRSGDIVTISCELTDELPPTSLSATLHWRDAGTPTPGAFAQLAMTHEGGGRFSAALEARPDKSIIEFYVRASDGASSRTWPAPGSEGQTANCVYQVDDEIESATAPTYRLILTAAENAAYEALAAEFDGPGNIFSVAARDRVFNTTFVATEGGDAAIRYRAGVRIRGQSSRKFVNKPLRVSFPGDDAWGGVTRFNLNPKYPWVQFLAMRLLQASGLPGSDASPVEVRRNGIEHVTGDGTDPDYGMWTRIAALDGDFVDRHWPGIDGVQLYRKSSGQTDWEADIELPATPDGVYSGWVKQNGGAANDWSDVAQFSERWQSVMAAHFSGGDPGDAASGTWNRTAFSDEEVALLAEVVDLDQFARWFAAMTLLNNREKNIATGIDNDYAGAWVPDGEFRRLQLVPYDMDNVLGKGDAPAGAAFGGLYNMTDVADVFKPLLPLFGDDRDPGNAAFLETYHRAIRELAGTVFDADTSANPYPPFHAFIDNHLGDWVPEHVRTELKDHMTARQDYLLSLIGAGKILPPAPASSATFTRPSAGNLRINEVLAVNQALHAISGSYPDIIELHNAGASDIQLAGHVIADESNEYVFPPGSGNVPAGGYRIIHSGTLGFGLGSGGDRVRLGAPGGEVLDEVVFGPQLADLSIARTAADPDTWALCAPTIGAPNGDGVALGTPDHLSLNEWAGNPDYRLDDDFVEIHNAAADPVALGGVRITDRITTHPSRFSFPELSFIGGGAFLALDSDDLGFGIDGRFENIRLAGANGTVIDDVALFSQNADESNGLNPDGGTTWARYPVPTPGISNAVLIPAASELFAKLRITEVMYAPNGGGDFEFVELQNIGDHPLDLEGVRFTAGISYEFPAGTALPGGGYIVVCKHRASFLNRYPGKSGVLAPGAYTGSLANEGEVLALTLPAPGNVNILRFRYRPEWYPATLGGGRSLHTRDQGVTPPADWEKSSTWVASAAVHGSPGSGEPPVIVSAAAAGGVVDAPFAYVIAATGSPFSYGAVGLPPGLSVDPGTGLISGTPAAAGVFPVSISAACPAGVAEAALELTVVSHGPLDHFTWDFAPETAYAGHGFGVRISARDAGGRLKADYSGSVSLRGFTSTPGASPVLITEVSDGIEDQFELQNVTGSPVDTSGWFVVLGDTATNINARNPTGFLLPALVHPGAVLRVSDSNSPGRLYFGADIRWSHSNPRGWIMLFDATTKLRDFVSFGQWTASQLGGLSITVNGKTISPVASGMWSGGSIAGDPARQSPNHWQRAGSSDHNNASDWSWSLVESSPGSPNPGLSLPWLIEFPLSLTPSSAAFLNGEFTGTLSIAEAASGVRLEAFDAFGHSGASNPFDLDFIDTDEDGMPDEWELANGLSPEDPEDALLDRDGDGQSNLDEFLAGTDPRSAASVFAITSGIHDPAGETFTIEWPAVAGKFYRVASSEGLDSWDARATRLAESSGTLHAEIPTDGQPRRFYRVEIAR